MQYIWDETGRRYLDALGGIVTVSVGHCHPKVVEAAKAERIVAAFDHDLSAAQYCGVCGNLAAKMPRDLKVCYFVNSGSEANDLALLMARAYTGNYDVIALRNAYHGGMLGMGLTAHQTWKFNVPHSFGVHHSITPDPYRGHGDTTIPKREKNTQPTSRNCSTTRLRGRSPPSSPNRFRALAAA